MTSDEKSLDAGNRIFISGNILTMDSANSVVEAVAVRDGRIEAVGSNEKIRKLTTADTAVVDLEGKTLLPGFIETHGHFPFSGVNAVAVKLNSPPIGEMTAIKQVIGALKQKAAETEKGKWVFGFGYDDTLLEEKCHLTCSDLDKVSVDHPVCVVHISGHLGYANSAGLKKAGIDRDTPDPEGGVICRDEKTKEPTGVLEETAAHLVTQLAMVFSMEENMAIIKWAIQDYISAGVTTAQAGLVTEAQLNGLSGASQFEQIPLRVIAWPDVELAEKIVEGKFEIEPHNTDMFRIGAAKIIGDGSIQGYTAHLTKPYHIPFKGDKEYRGYPVTGRKAMVELVKEFHKAGMQIAIHGNGDATIDDIIYAVNEAQKEHPREDHRHIVIHAQTSRLDQLDEMKRLGLTPSFFSAHAYYWGDRHWNIFLGPERAGRQNPAGTALEKGIRFTIHLDTPVTPINPLLLVWSAVNRISTGGKIIGKEERITTLQALRAVTIDGAWQIFQEANRGSLETGKFADMVVLSDDPLKDPAVIKDIEVLATIVGGNTVYKKES